MHIRCHRFAPALVWALFFGHASAQRAYRAAGRHPSGASQRRRAAQDALAGAAPAFQPYAEVDMQDIAECRS